MTLKNSIIVSALVSLVVGLAFWGFTHESVTQPTPSSVVSEDGSVGAGGNVNQQIDVYPNGLTIGDRTVIFKGGLIGPRQNQASYRNRTGRPLLIQMANIGFDTGTATSSYAYYVGTSTVATLTNDFARPFSASQYAMINAATTATGTTRQIITSTTTPAGVGSVILRDGEYLNFAVQERYACAANAACETATSTNRGITNFLWGFRAVFLNQ